MFPDRQTADFACGTQAIMPVCTVIAVFVATYIFQRIQLQTHGSSIRTNRATVFCSCIRKNKANAVVVFEGSPILCNMPQFHLNQYWLEPT